MNSLENKQTKTSANKHTNLPTRHKTHPHKALPVASVCDANHSFPHEGVEKKMAGEEAVRGEERRK